MMSVEKFYALFFITYFKEFHYETQNVFICGGFSAAVCSKDVGST
jgi:hypothetical protein